MDTLFFPASDPRNLGIARRLAKLDEAMRRNLTARAAVRARVRFFVEAVRAGVQSDCELNSLGDLAEKHGKPTMLSERSYNLVFEDGEISHQAVREIVRMADSDPAFEAILNVAHKASLAYWRASAKKEAQPCLL